MNRVIIHDAKNQQWLLFENPCYIVNCDRLEQVIPGLEQVNQSLQQQHLWAAGFISYEASSAWDSALTTYPPDEFPLLWFGLYEQPQIITPPRLCSPSDYTVGEWLSSVTPTEYQEAIKQIRGYIARGETYQVNYTFRLRTEFSGDALAWFWQLVRSQQADYAAYIECGDRFTICSASPELFFQLSDRQLVARPMKGTAPRGCTLTEDNAIAQGLQNSPKNRAENVMIVDMIRNDISRIGDIKTVQVPQLFTVEKYPTLWQMTSTVTAKTQALPSEIIAALFPCASITGAPKPRTMQLIRQLETTPRHLYTGTIGFIEPENSPNNYRTQFNVAIRTVIIDRQNHQAEYGVGGGILWDSDSQDEYQECQTKAKFLSLNNSSDFSLLETMLWTPEAGFFLREDHLKRLSDSAIYFGIPLSVEHINQQLIDISKSWSIPYRVRLLVDRQGVLNCEISAIEKYPPNRQIYLGLSPTPINSQNPFLYHKTTNRSIYETARNSRPDCDDVILWNERGEVTETTIANLIIKINDDWLTPPVTSGLLPGTFRGSLLKQGKIKEAIIDIETLQKSEDIYIINSVRQWQKATLKTTDLS
ncbi:aminodeoxychorismate synthase component I [Limnospira platensis]|uniref:aminodeoxychorismate synthase component I n=1 Tax=Limnospira platensis TaxID=118562 RepID=UPI003D6FDE40